MRTGGRLLGGPQHTWLGDCTAIWLIGVVGGVEESGEGGGRPCRLYAGCIAVVSCLAFELDSTSLDLWFPVMAVSIRDLKSWKEAASIIGHSYLAKP